MELEGIITALVTPFKNRALDEEGLKTNIRFQIEGKAHALLALGTTGEVSTLSQTERDCVVKIVMEEAKGKVPVGVNVGDNCTLRTINNAQLAEKAGADFLLAITPYYIRPTQKGLIEHFKQLSESTSLPILLYHHPLRTGTTIELETLMELAAVPNIVGLKEASGDLSLVCQALFRLPKSFALFSGEDFSTFPLVALGAKGVISSLSNLVPTPMVEMYQLIQKGDLKGARVLHEELFPLCELASLETNPIGIKAMMDCVNMPAGPCRMPLTPLSDERHARLKSLLLQSNIVTQMMYA